MCSKHRVAMTQGADILLQGHEYGMCLTPPTDIKRVQYLPVERELVSVLAE